MNEGEAQGTWAISMPTPLQLWTRTEKEEGKAVPAEAEQAKRKGNAETGGIKANLVATRQELEQVCLYMSPTKDEQTS